MTNDAVLIILKLAPNRTDLSVPPVLNWDSVEENVTLIKLKSCVMDLLVAANICQINSLFIFDRKES